MEFCLICEQSVISVRTSSLTAAIASRQPGIRAALREAMAAGGSELRGGFPGDFPCPPGKVQVVSPADPVNVENLSRKI